MSAKFSFINNRWHAAKGNGSFVVKNPDNGDVLHSVPNDGSDEVNQAVAAAKQAYSELRLKSGTQIADFICQLADEIEALGDELLEAAHLETGLGLPRLTGERGRTCGQLLAFANLVREGSWQQAVIDTAQPDRQPLAKPDIRKCARPLGPIAIFSAVNFPFAFAVLGGDTVSALASGNPVVVKGHPSHAKTSSLFAKAAQAAIEKCGFPTGTLSLLQGNQPQLSRDLTNHPDIEAVGFTGSLKVGRILYDLAAKRDRPIPVYAELGSINPVFLLPGALSDRSQTIAQGLAGSITLGTGQFCTQPGLVVYLKKDSESFTQHLTEALQAVPAGLLLNENIAATLQRQVANIQKKPSITNLLGGQGFAGRNRYENTLLQADAKAFINDAELCQEMFGPVSLLVPCDNEQEMLAIAERIGGNLTATVHGETSDKELSIKLTAILEDRAGRLIYNGFPTGVEVCAAMQHGGPYPASTAANTTSVGTAAITRFTRVCAYQNYPQHLLPEVLRNENPGKCTRLIDSVYTNAEII